MKIFLSSLAIFCIVFVMSNCHYSAAPKTEVARNQLPSDSNTAVVVNSNTGSVQLPGSADIRVTNQYVERPKIRTHPQMANPKPGSGDAWLDTWEALRNDVPICDEAIDWMIKIRGRNSIRDKTADQSYEGSMVRGKLYGRLKSYDDTSTAQEKDELNTVCQKSVIYFKEHYAE